MPTYTSTYAHTLSHTHTHTHTDVTVWELQSSMTVIDTVKFHSETSHLCCKVSHKHWWSVTHLLDFDASHIRLSQTRLPIRVLVCGSLSWSAIGLGELQHIVTGMLDGGWDISFTRVVSCCDKTKRLLIESAAAAGGKVLRVKDSLRNPA